MLKVISLTVIFFIARQGYSQPCVNCSSQFFIQFLNFPRKATGLQPFHYPSEQSYLTDNEAQKRTEDYKYVHNGDNLRGAQGLLAGDELGAGWIKNFDFGKFLSTTVEFGSDARGNPNGAFLWSGKLLFFKVANKRKLRV